MESSLKEYGMKNVLIVGANRGIGLSLAQEYVNQGMNVFTLNRGTSEVVEALIPIENRISGCDATDLTALKEAQASWSEVQFDLLIHNSGIWMDDNLFEAEQDFKDFTRVFEVNTIAALKVIHVFLNQLRAHSVVGLMSSRMGSIADNDSGGRFGYRMSKAALNAAGKSLAVDLKGKKIAVALLHPGYVKTDMTNHNGLISTQESAQGLINVLSKINLENTGRFWHSNGETLPW